MIARIVDPSNMATTKACTRIWSWLLPYCFGLATASALAFDASPVQAVAADIPFSFGPGLDFDYRKQNSNSPPITGGSLTGSFTLECSYALSSQDCVEYNGPTTNLIDGNTYDGAWIYFGTGSYLYQDIDVFSISWDYLNTVTATSAIYGYTLDGAYFLQFSDGQEFITLFLNDTNNASFSDPLPSQEGGAVPVAESVTTASGTLTSAICQNNIPPPAAITCPPGKNFLLSNFSGKVINLVPAPFGLSLLLPAGIVLRMRRRYSK